MRVHFVVEYEGVSYLRVLDNFPPITLTPKIRLSLWVHCGYYNFEVISHPEVFETPEGWQIDFELKALPITPHLREPLQFEADPNWKT